MNAIEQLYRNSGLVTEDGYVKVNDKLLVKSGPYQEKAWHCIDESDLHLLPTKAELDEIYLKVQELIQIQEACGLKSLKRILNKKNPQVWSDQAFVKCLKTGVFYPKNKSYIHFLIFVRRIP